MLSMEEQEEQEEVRKMHNIDLLAIRRPSRISEIEERIKKSCNPLPRTPLPRWEKLPLNQKLPLVPSTPGEFTISKGYLGESIFRCNCSQPFDILDPYIRETPTTYNALHDPALKKHFNERPDILNILVEQGLLTCDGDVLCSLEELNRAREYLSRLHNITVQAEKEHEDKLAAAAIIREKEIRVFTRRERNKQRHAEVAARLQAWREELQKQELASQMKPERLTSTRGKEQAALGRAYYHQHREFLRYQVILKLIAKEKALARHNRNKVLMWQCKDTYRSQVRCAWYRHQQMLVMAELEDFIRCKREYQEHKLRYERAILIKHKLEQECAVMRRSKLYKKVEKLRQTACARKEEMEKKRQARELYLLKKYGFRWLGIVAAKRRAVATYHDSLWATRGQLRELVEYLRDESGTISFTAFIKGLVKNMPGHTVIEMSDEAREVVTYILDLLLHNTFKTVARKKTSCVLDFWSDEVRRKIAKMNCPKQDIIKLEDFIPPQVKQRMKPQIPFEKPQWPTTGPCAKTKKKRGRHCSDYNFVDKIIIDKRDQLQKKKDDILHGKKNMFSFEDEEDITWIATSLAKDTLCKNCKKQRKEQRKQNKEKKGPGQGQEEEGEGQVSTSTQELIRRKDSVCKKIRKDKQGRLLKKKSSCQKILSEFKEKLKKEKSLKDQQRRASQCQQEQAVDETPKVTKSELQKDPGEEPKVAQSQQEQTPEVKPKVTQSQLAQTPDEIPKVTQSQQEQTPEEEPKVTESQQVQTSGETPKFTQTQKEQTPEKVPKVVQSQQQTPQDEPKITQSQQEQTPEEALKVTQNEQEKTLGEEPKITQSQQEQTPEDKPKVTESQQKQTSEEEPQVTESQQEQTSEDEPKVTQSQQEQTPEEPPKVTQSEQVQTPKEEPKVTESRQQQTADEAPKVTQAEQVQTPREEPKVTQSEQIQTPEKEPKVTQSQQNQTTADQPKVTQSQKKQTPDEKPKITPSKQVTLGEKPKVTQSQQKQPTADQPKVTQSRRKQTPDDEPKTKPSKQVTLGEEPKVTQSQQEQTPEVKPKVTQSRQEQTPGEEPKVTQSQQQQTVEETPKVTKSEQEQTPEDEPKVTQSQQEQTPEEPTKVTKSEQEQIPGEEPKITQTQQDEMADEEPKVTSSEQEQTAEKPPKVTQNQQEQTPEDEAKVTRSAQEQSQGDQPLRRTPSDYSWVDKIIRDKQENLQQEVDEVLEGRENNLVLNDEEDISWIASCLTTDTLCKQMREERKKQRELKQAQPSQSEQSLRRTPSDYSWVDKIIRDKQENLQQEVDEVVEGRENELVFNDEEDISWIASCLATDTLCKQMREERKKQRELKQAQQSQGDQPVRRTPSDYSWVDKIIRDKQDNLQQEVDEVVEGRENELLFSDEEDISWIASCLATDSLCKQMQEERKKQRELKKAQQNQEDQPLRRTPSDYSWVDKIIKDKQANLQQEKDQVLEGRENQLVFNDDESISRIASCLATDSICKQMRNERKKGRELDQEQQSQRNQPPRRKSSDYSWVEKIIKDKQSNLQQEVDEVHEVRENERVVNDEGTISSTPAQKEMKQVQQNQEDQPPPRKSSDYAWVEKIIKEKQSNLQLEVDKVWEEKEKDSALNDEESTSRIPSGMVTEVERRKQEELKQSQQKQEDEETSQLASSQSSVSYLDPSESGISPLRSEIRLQLNLLRQELDELKTELRSQGIIHEDSPLTPSTTTRTPPPPPPP